MALKSTYSLFLFNVNTKNTALNERLNLCRKYSVITPSLLVIDQVRQDTLAIKYGAIMIYRPSQQQTPAVP